MNHNSTGSGYPIGRAGRVLLGLWSLFLLAGFALALSLEPDPRGFGTHQRLGLPPCTFIAMFEIPCPSCGMTTSFANFVRGRFVEAARANLAGLLLAAICAVQIPWCWVSIRSGRLWRVNEPDMMVLWLLLAVCGACLVQWAARLFSF
jgi:hypothetical protein